MNLVIRCYLCLSCLLLYRQPKVQRENLSLLSELQLFFLNCTAISDSGEDVHHPRDCLIAIDELVVTLPLTGKSMK